MTKVKIPGVGKGLSSGMQCSVARVRRQGARRTWHTSAHGARIACICPPFFSTSRREGCCQRVLKPCKQVPERSRLGVGSPCQGAVTRAVTVRVQGGSAPAATVRTLPSPGGQGDRGRRGTTPDLGGCCRVLLVLDTGHGAGSSKESPLTWPSFI